MHKANVDTAPVSPRTPSRIPTTLPCEKRGGKQEDGLPTRPTSPPSEVAQRACSSLSVSTIHAQRPTQTVTMPVPSARLYS